MKLLKEKSKTARKKGFTLIELIVVIAILGVLVLLATPKFIGYVGKANDSNIKSDIKTYETTIIAKLTKDPDYTEDWDNLTEDEIDQMIEDGTFYSEKGPITIDENHVFKDVEEDDVKSRLPGEFIYDETSEKVYYFDDKKTEIEDNGNPPVVTPEEPETPVEQLFTWRTDVAKGERIITGYIGSSTDVVVPSEIKEEGETEGLPVVEIGYAAFQSKGLTSVVIPSTVRTIGSYSFAGNTIKSIEIPSSVTKIDYSAFSNSGIEEITFNEGLTTVGSSAFSTNKIEHLILPQSLTKIPGLMFYENKELKTVEFSENIKDIGERSFEGSRIASLILPEGLEIVRHKAFGSSPIKTLVIPESLTEIQTAAFATNDLEIEITVHPNNPNYSNDSSKKGIYSKDKTRLVYGTKDIIGTPEFNNITEIEAFAFPMVSEVGTNTIDFNMYVENLVLPSTLKKIVLGKFTSGSMPVNWALGDTTVTFPSSITTIQAETLSGFANQRVSVRNNTNIDINARGSYGGASTIGSPEMYYGLYDDTVYYEYYNGIYTPKKLISIID